MADDRAAQIARIQQIERIHALEGASGGPNGTPTTQDIGVTDGPTPAAVEDAPTGKVQSVINAGKTGLAAGAKGLDYLSGTTTRPAFAAALGALTGKPVFKGDELAQAANPLTTQRFPDSDELYKRAGVPQGAKLSDYVPGYGAPGKSPWYQPEKGGMLDPTVRGTGGFATDVALDPLTYMSLGTNTLAKEAAEKGAAKAALKEASASQSGKLGQVLDMGANGINKAVDTVAMPTTALAEKASGNRVGQVLKAAATSPSETLDKLGKYLYGSMLQPVEFQGQQFGKKGVIDTLQDAGIKTPFGLRDKAQNAVNALMDARGKIFSDAEAAGGKVDMKAAMTQAQDAVDKMRAQGGPTAQKIADTLQAKIDEHMNLVGATPAVAPTSSQVATGVLDANGKPIMKTVNTPGTAASPGKALSPAQASQWKSELYTDTPDAAWNELRKTPTGAKITQPLSQGLKEETENSVGRALGPEAGANVADLNDAAGGLLSTSRAQAHVDRNIGRITHNPTAGTTAIVAALGGWKDALMKLGMDGGRLATMPVGYGMSSVANNPLAATAFDSYTRKKIIQKLGKETTDGQSN